MIQTTRYYYYRKQWQWQWFKALYELRRSPRLWQQTFIKALTELGLQQGTEDSCVFFSNEYYIFLLVLIEKEEPTLKRDYVRHVDIHHHWVRQESQNNNNIHVQWTPTSQMPANGLTKALHSISETQSCTPKPQVPLQQSWWLRSIPSSPKRHYSKDHCCLGYGFTCHCVAWVSWSGIVMLNWWTLAWSPRKKWVVSGCRALPEYLRVV